MDGLSLNYKILLHLLYIAFIFSFNLEYRIKMADAKQSTPLSALPAEINDWMSNERKYSRYCHHYHEMQKWMRDYVSSWKLNRSQGTSDPVDGQHQYHIRFVRQV